MSETKLEKRKPAVIQQREGTPQDMIRLAVEKGADLDKLEKLLGLQERWEANEARKAYHKSMAAFKENPPKIKKDKTVNYKTDKGTVKYNHATLANVVEQITAELSKHDLSASWRTQQNGTISVTCRITHALGHSEETMLTANADQTGSKNSIQAIGSTITYLQRYTLLALLGLATKDQDDDGKAAEPVAVISEQQLSALLDMIASTETDAEKFLKYMGVETLEEMPANLYTKAMNMLNSKAAKRK